MPMHPQAEAVLRKVPRIWFDLDSMTVAKARAMRVDKAVGSGDSRLSGVDVEDVELPGADGPLRGRVYRPSESEPAGALLWIHGGGFIVGTLDTETVPAPLALASGCTVVAVEYRLAPEHPFPAGLEDCWAALGWVAEHAQALGGDAGRIAVGGDSAGGNLAAAVSLMARDRGGPQLALQVLLYPMTARVFDGGSRHDPTVSPTAPPEAINWLWRHYLGAEDVATSPLFSPLDAETLAGLPPALVITAEYDVLRDEGEAYAQRLEREGVPVELRHYEGMFHGFANYPGVIDAADDCIHVMGTALRKAVALAAGNQSAA
jgi:acetyl esterase